MEVLCEIDNLRPSRVALSHPTDSTGHAPVTIVRCPPALSPATATRRVSSPCASPLASSHSSASRVSSSCAGYLCSGARRYSTLATTAPLACRCWFRWWGEGGGGVSVGVCLCLWGPVAGRGWSRGACDGLLSFSLSLTVVDDVCAGGWMDRMGLKAAHGRGGDDTSNEWMDSSRYPSMARSTQVQTAASRRAILSSELTLPTVHPPGDCVQCNILVSHGHWN